MRIGIFTETYCPTTNGVVVSVDTFRHELEKRGHNYTIFAPENPKQKGREPHVYRLPSITFPNDSIYPLARPVSLNNAAQHLPVKLIEQLDIIHIQHFSMMGQYGLGFGERYKIPTVYTYHTMAELYGNYAGFLAPLIAQPIRAWSRYTAQRAKQVIVPTKSIKNYLRDIGVSQPISIIPTGIHTSLYKRTPKAHLSQKYGVPSGRDILLFVGRLSEEKNIGFLLQAFKQIVLAQPNTHLVIVGDGPDRHKYELFVQTNGLSQMVTFTGFQSREETITIFGAADIFSFPSVTETQGIVVIEAMAAGTVPVAVDCRGPHDLINDGQTGYLVDLNLAEFSGTIINLLNDEAKLNQLAHNARQEAKNFDVRVTADAMENLYVKLISHYRP